MRQRGLTEVRVCEWELKAKFGTVSEAFNISLKACTRPACALCLEHVDISLCFGFPLRTLPAVSKV